MVDYIPMLAKGTLETLYMTVMSTLFSYLFGLPLGVWVYITQKGNLRPNRGLNTVLSWIVNIGRSIPFIILIVALIPFTRLIVGTAIGPTAAIVPLIVAAIPFVARMVESSLEELDRGVIEAAKAMGASDLQIILHVCLPEAVPSIIRGVSITAITLVGYSAMAGAVRYGYQRYQGDVMWITVVLLVIIVALIQFAFNTLARVIDKRNK